MSPDYDQMPLSLTLDGFRRDYPGWIFAIRHRFDGAHLEAYRPQATSGLYAVISADPEELRRELDNAPVHGPGRLPDVR